MGKFLEAEHYDGTDGGGVGDDNEGLLSLD